MDLCSVLFCMFVCTAIVAGRNLVLSLQTLYYKERPDLCNFECDELCVPTYYVIRAQL